MCNGKQQAHEQHSPEIPADGILEKASEEEFLGERYSEELKQNGIDRDRRHGSPEDYVVGCDNDERYDEPQQRILDRKTAD